MANPSTSKPNSSQQEIIHAAAQLFVQQGYHGTSMRQIAKASGLALGSAYNHFPSKEAIFKAVFLEYHPYNDILPYLISINNIPIEEFLQKAIDALGESLKERPYFLNLLFIEIVEFDGVHIFELFKQVVPNAGQIPIGLIKNNPRIRSIPPLILMRTMMGMIVSYYTIELTFAKIAPPEFRENASSYVIDILLHGILLPDSDTQSKPSQA